MPTRIFEAELLDAIAAKKAELDRLRPLAPEGLRNLEHSYDLELTYTSNAIEGNTLTAAETSLVIEHGITIAGKPLRDHLEAIASAPRRCLNVRRRQRPHRAFIDEPDPNARELSADHRTSSGSPRLCICFAAIQRVDRVRSVAL